MRDQSICACEKERHGTEKQLTNNGQLGILHEWAHALIC